LKSAILKIIRHRLFENISALTILQAANFILPLLILPYLTRVLGIEIFGVVAFSVAIAQTAFILTDFGFSLSATHEISVNREDRKEVEKILSAVLFIKLCLFILASIIIVLFITFYTKYSEHYYLFILTLLPIFGQTFQPIWFFQGIEKLKNVVIYTFLSRIVYVLMIFLLVNDKSSYLYVPVANGVAHIIAALIGIHIIAKMGYKLRIPSSKKMLEITKTTLHFFFSRAAVAFYTSGSVIFLSIYGSSYQVSIFSVAEQLYKAIQHLFLPIITSLFPFMAKEKNFSLFYKILFFSIIVCVIGGVIGFFVAPYLIQILFGTDYYEATNVFRLFLFIIVINIPSILLGYPFFAAFNKNAYASNSVLVGSLFHIIVTLLIGNLFGLDSMMVVYIVAMTETIVFSIRIFLVIKLLKMNRAQL